MAIWTRLTVAEFQQAVHYRNGRFVGLLGPGAHRLFHWFLHETAAVVDVRKQVLLLSGQEFLTRDHVPVRLTLAADHRVVDPCAALHKVQSWTQQLYVDLQLALRETASSRSFDELLDAKLDVGAEVLSRTASAALEFGVELSRVAVRDVSMPASIRDMMLKTVEAEKSAQAALIKAREEVAAARSRANAARLTAESPGAMRLKELETLFEMSRYPGNTVVFQLGSDPLATLGALKGNA